MCFVGFFCFFFKWDECKPIEWLFHVCVGYTTFCKYLIGLRDNISTEYACMWYADDMALGGWAQWEAGSVFC